MRPKRAPTVVHRTEYDCYKVAKRRCQPDWVKAEYYAERGIEFRFASFYEFFKVMGPRPSPKHTIDRFPNNDGHYEAGNVRWATWEEQVKNKRPRRPTPTLRSATNEQLLIEVNRRGLSL